MIQFKAMDNFLPLVFFFVIVICCVPAARSAETSIEIVSDVVRLSFSVIDENCVVSFWKRKGDVRTKIQFRTSKKNHENKRYCVVYIEREAFESHFKFCYLAGFSILDGSKGNVHVNFGHASKNPSNRYFFEWMDVGDFIPYYDCITQTKRRSTGE